jgi:PAS domain S-box-containing protein
MNQFFRQCDWSKTALGPHELWSESLRTAVNICLFCPTPILVIWGREMTQIYNEAYAEIIGDRHPQALGEKADKVWADIWHEIGPMLHNVMANGSSFKSEGSRFILYRNNKPEERYFSFTYSPIYSNSTTIEGIFVSVVDTTDVVVNTKKVRALRNQQLGNLFAQAPIALAVLKGPEYLVEIANERILEIWDKTLVEVLDKPVFQAVSDARDQGYESLLESVYSTGKRVVIEEVPLALTRKGVRETLFLKVVYEALREPDGTISGIMVLADEITQQVASRKAIEESELRLKIAVEAAAIGTYDWQIQQSFFQYSERLAEIFGFENTKGILQKSFGDRIHPDDQTTRMKAHDVAFATGNLFYEARVVLPNDAIRWIRVNGKVTYDEQNKPARLYGTVLDVTDEHLQADQLQRLVNERTQKLQERNAQLQRSEERYHKMVDEVQDYAIILMDSFGLIQNWNRGAQKIKGYRESDIIGKHFRIFYLPEDQQTKLPEKLIKDASDTGRAMHEGWRVRKDGSKFWGSITITALHNSKNDIIGFSKVTRDLTQKKEAEDKLLQYTAELEMQNRELEQFAYVASHDLQEPLRKIRTFTEIIQKNINNEAAVKKYFERIDASAERMSDLIKSVLNFSRLSRGESQLVDVNLSEIVRHVCTDFELLIQDRNATIELESLPVVKAVQLQMTQLFSNLIGNALKFNNKPPFVTVKSKIVSSDQIINKPNFLNDYSYHEISVSDNGIGFDERYEKQIFTMFQRLHGKHEYAGTGIGLALCKKIVENHNGFITAKSELGKGSTFFVYLPVN